MLRPEKEDGLIVRDRKERLPLDGLRERGYRGQPIRLHTSDMFRCVARVYVRIS